MKLILSGTLYSALIPRDSRCMNYEFMLIFGLFVVVAEEVRKDLDNLTGLGHEIPSKPSPVANTR